MGAKSILLSADDITYYLLPGSSGELAKQAGSLDDTIFGQSFKSAQPGVIGWSITTDAVFKGYPGYVCSIKKPGTAVVMTTEACTLVFAGRPASMKGYQLEKGWNLITGDSQEVRMAQDVFKNCVVTGGPWIYDLSWGDGGRYREDTLIGMYGGYAVEVAESCVVNV